MGYQVFGQVINRAGQMADFGHKEGKGFGKRAAGSTPSPNFSGNTTPQDHTFDKPEIMRWTYLSNKQSSRVCHIETAFIST